MPFFFLVPHTPAPVGDFKVATFFAPTPHPPILKEDKEILIWQNSQCKQSSWWSCQRRKGRKAPGRKITSIVKLPRTEGSVTRELSRSLLCIVWGTHILWTLFVDPPLPYKYHRTSRDATQEPKNMGNSRCLWGTTDGYDLISTNPRLENQSPFLRYILC